MLTRPRVLRGVAALCVGALACVPVVAGAQTTKDRVAATRSAVDKAAQRWFDAQNKAASLDNRIQQLESDIATAEARATTARKVATARALVMYEGASQQQYATIFGTNAMDTARRAQLVDVANAKNADAIAELTASLDDLRQQKQQLETERNRQQKALAEVASERQSLDAQLSSLTTKAQQEARAAALAAARRRTAQVVKEATSSNAAAPTATPTRRAVATYTAPAPAPAPAPPQQGGVSSHHNDPFLVCTRARESGGNYGIVSASGYYGAYQFLPSTWDVTANHAGRADLVGVLPSRASVFDQDELAWALYQWQGKGPWGGRC